MGLNLQVMKFHYWLELMVERSFQKEFLKRLTSHIGKEVDFSKFDLVKTDTGFPRVGSYTAYGIFRYCLQFIVTGDYEDQLEQDDIPEKEALLHFRRHLTPGFANIPYAAHILETNDVDTLFLPILFEEPFELYDEEYEIDIGSLPAVLTAMEALSKALSFDLQGEFEEEYPDDKWDPISTARNVARIIFRFFKENENYCIVFS